MDLYEELVSHAYTHSLHVHIYGMREAKQITYNI